MKMDTSFWIQCNPKITVDHTTKKFYGKFLYKLVVYCPAGRLIDAKGSMPDALEHRRTVAKNINHGGWWGRRTNPDLENADVEFLTMLKEVRHDRGMGIKLRVEEPMIQIYADSESALQTFVNTHFSATQKQYVRSISGPIDSAAETVLNSGAIIRKENNGYQYKIILKDGRYTSEIKQNLLVYLENQGPEQVQLSSSARLMLSKSTGYVWNLYFYCNDVSVITFLNLISPGIVSNYHELVVLSNK
jgi:hypothetical protein